MSRGFRFSPSSAVREPGCAGFEGRHSRLLRSGRDDGTGLGRLLQFHRWLSIAFTLGFIVNILALTGGKEPPFWVYLLVLIPLFLLLPTGL